MESNITERLNLLKERLINNRCYFFPRYTSLSEIVKAAIPTEQNRKSVEEIYQR